MIASDFMPEVPLEGSWIMNADHTKAQLIKECEVVSMVGFGSYHCILEDKDGNEEARIIHGKDLHWVGDYWLQIQRPYRIDVKAWDEKSYEYTELDTQRVSGAIGDVGERKPMETKKRFQYRGMRAGIRHAKMQGASGDILIKRVHQMQLDLEPERIISQILGDLISPSGNERLFNMFNSEYGRAVIPGQLKRSLLNIDKVNAFSDAVNAAWDELTGGNGIWWIVSDEEEMLACTECCRVMEDCSCAIDKMC
tara:strand:- start:5910 stop:6665 length:756 start_codon:yes stop_codon:yes gene_type:complete